MAKELGMRKGGIERERGGGVVDLEMQARRARILS